MADVDSQVSTGKRSMLLSGLGFYKLSARRRKQLGIMFGVSLAVHVIGLLAFGGWIVMRSRPEEVTIFQTPPPSRTYEPRKLEHKIRLKKRQRSSSRPSMVPRLVAMKMSQVALPEIKMDPKLIHTTFQPKFKAVSGKGLGAGLGSGYGTHGFGEGISSVNFFGIRARGEKIAILVDVSVSMVEEERGGTAGYEAVKRRVNQVVDALGEASLFNMMVFADGASAMSKELVLSSKENKTKAKMFVRPFNTQGNWGLSSGNLSSSAVGVPAYGGTTRLDLPLSAAFEMGADTVLIISDGIPRVRKGHTTEQLRAHNAMVANWQQKNAAQIENWQQQQQAVTFSEEKVWVPARPATPERVIPARPASKRPPKEGQAPDRGSPRRVIPAQPARAGYWKVVQRRHGGGGHRPQAPGMPDPGWWTLADFVEHLNILYEKYYKPQGRKPPEVHCIGYQIDKDGDAFLKDLARHYHGKYRRVAKIK